MAFKDIIIGIVVLALFVISLIAWTGNMELFNNVNNSLLNEPTLKGLNDSLIGNIVQTKDTAQSSRTAFESQEAQASANSDFSLTSIVGIIKSFLGGSIGTFNLIFKAMSDILGIPPIVFTAIFGIIIMLLLILGWRLIRGGGV